MKSNLKLRPTSWLHSLVPIWGFMVPMSFLAWSLPAELCEKIWIIPKFFCVQEMLFVLIAALSLSAGIVGGETAGFRDRRRKPGKIKDSRILFSVAYWMTLLGYVIWGFVAYRRGLNTAELASLLRDHPEMLKEGGAGVGSRAETEGRVSSKERMLIDHQWVRIAPLLLLRSPGDVDVPMTARLWRASYGC